LTNRDHKSFINVPTGKLPHFMGLTLLSGSTWWWLILLVFTPVFGRLCAADLSHRKIPKNQQMKS
jgi:hypothetical protein